MRRNNRFAIFAGLALMLASGVALAQGVPTFNVDQINGATQAGDWSRKIWEAIFGTFATSPFSPGTPNTILGNLFITFNAAIFAIGTAWLGYGVVSGIIGTTQDGQALGQKINSSWYPIRVVIGIGGMLPIMGGYTISQAMLMSIAGLGIGTANLMWTTAVSSPAMTGLVNAEAFSSKPILGRAEVLTAVGNMFKSHVCMIETARVQKITTESGATVLERDRLDIKPLTTYNSVKIQYGSIADPTACGSVTFTMDKVRTNTSAVSYRIDSVDYAGIRQNVAAAMSDKLATLNQLVGGIAQSYVTAVNQANRAQSDAPTDFDAKQISGAVDSYLSDAQSVVFSSTGNKTSAVTEAAKAKMLAGGWMAAGSFYGTFAEANAALADSVSGARLTTTPPIDSRIYAEAGEAARKASAYVEKVAERESNTAIFCGPDGSGMMGTDSGNCSLGQAIVSAVIGSTMRGSGGGSSAVLFSGKGEVGLVNPVVGMKNVGDYIMTLASTLILYERASNSRIDVSKGPVDVVGKIIEKSGAAALSQVPVVGTILDELAPFGWMLLALGALLAIYVPFLPLIAWVGGMIAYTASFIEGLVAMPLHSMAHMHSDGEGLGQQTAHGYLFALNTFARPPLMVIAFFIASALVIALGTVVTYMFLPAMANVQGNSMTGVASIIGFIVVYFVLMNVVINGCFDLIHVIPDQVIGFVGSGNVSTKLGSDAENKISALYMSGVRGGAAGGQANIQRANQKAANAATEARAKQRDGKPSDN